MLKGLLISAAVSALLSGLGTWKITHDLAQAKVARITAGYAEAERKALAEQEKRLLAWGETNVKAAADEGQAQLVIEHHINTVRLETTRYVTVHQPCLTFGFVRVYDAAVLGVSPDQLSLPADKSNDDCSPLDPAAVAQALVANIGVARANAEQLNALSALTRKY